MKAIKFKFKNDSYNMTMTIETSSMSKAIEIFNSFTFLKNEIEIIEIKAIFINPKVSG